MIRVVKEYQQGGLRADGTLWSCGHPLDSLVKDELGQVVCGACSGIQTDPEILESPAESPQLAAV